LAGHPLEKTKSDLSRRSRELIDAGAALFRLGLVPATSGNFSARLGDGNIAITVSGRHKGELTEQDIMVINAEGQALDDRRPSAETGLHVQIYRRFPNIGAVLHPHSKHAVVLSRIETEQIVLRDYELLKALSGIDTHATTVTVPVFANDQNIPRLSQAVDAYLEANEAVYGYIIAGHGFYTWGATVAEAVRHVEALDYLFSCELYLRGIHHT